MKVDGLDIDVGVEEVLVEKNRSFCVMGHVEHVVIDILRCLLQSNDVSSSCNLLFEGIFFSASGLWVPRYRAASAQVNDWIHLC